MKETLRRSQWLGASLSRGKRLIYPLIALTSVATFPTIHASTVLTDNYSSNSPGTRSSVALAANDLAATRLVVVTLKMRNLSELQARVGKGEVISDSEMAAKYLPLASDYQAILQWLQSQGLTLQQDISDEESISVSGSITQIQNALGITFGKVGFEGKTYVSTFNPPTVPDALAPAILAIHGLQPEIHYYTHAVPAAPPGKDIVISGGGSTNGTAYSHYGTPYAIGDIENAYNAANLGLNGTGQTIAIIMDGVPLQSDLNAFWNYNGYGTTAPSFTDRKVDGGVSGQGHDQLEATLDISWAQGIAPGAHIILYEVPDLSESSIVAAYAAMTLDIKNGTTINILSMSYGGAESANLTSATTDASKLTTLSGKGITMFASSGDGGSNPDPKYYGPTSKPNNTTPESPASVPCVTGVGGTTLILQGNGSDAVSSEVGWSTQLYTPPGSPAYTAGSGGGVSIVNSRPSWQSYPGVPSGSMRCVPDVALAADGNYGCVLIVNGQGSEYGGTSWAAPMWAGFCARFNQALLNSGNPTLGGSLNSQLYALASTTALLRDITSGNNGAYYANTGYDLVTGLGVFNFATLTHELAAPFFKNETDLGNTYYFLNLPNGNLFGYYSDNGPGYTFPEIFHQDLGFEFIFNAGDSGDGIYMFDYKTGHFFYTSTTYPWPYLYDFTLGATLYYYPDSNTSDPDHQHRYSHNPRCFYNTATGQNITQ